MSDFNIEDFHNEIFTGLDVHVFMAHLYGETVIFNTTMSVKMVPSMAALVEAGNTEMRQQIELLPPLNHRLRALIDSYFEQLKLAHDRLSEAKSTDWDSIVSKLLEEGGHGSDSSDS